MRRVDRSAARGFACRQRFAEGTEAISRDYVRGPLCPCEGLYQLEAGEQGVGRLEGDQQDTRTIHGAEAKYLLAQLYYDNKDDKNAETVLMNFIENGTPHQYWLARGFILLLIFISAKVMISKLVNI